MPNTFSLLQKRFADRSEQGGHVLVCPDCGQAEKHPGQSIARCRRCGAELLNPGGSRQSVAALALTSLVFLGPAVAMPLLHIEVAGRQESCTVLEGAAMLVSGGHLFLAVVVFSCVLLVPLLYLLTLLFLVLPGLLESMAGIGRVAMLTEHHLAEWSMAEIYLLGLLVAAAKLTSMGFLYPGPGLPCLVAFSLLLLAAESRLDRQDCWRRLGAGS